MKLLESELYKSDLHRALQEIDLRKLDNRVVFVTGGLGLIGSSVVDLLIQYGGCKKIYVGARKKQEFDDRFGGYDKVEYIEYNALDSLDLDIEFDYLIYGAGLASPELYVSEPVETILSNFHGIQELLDYSVNNKIKRVLYISSSEVYGRNQCGDPFLENNYGIINIDNIRSSYAIAKITSEMICKAYAYEYGIDVVIVRPGHIYGPSAKVSDKRISSDFAFKAAMGKTLEMKSDGQQKRSYCYSLDCAKQILIALLKGKNTEIYNVGHDEVCTIKKMAEVYAKAGNVDLCILKPEDNMKIVFNPMNNSSLDNKKIKKLGYQDSFSLEEGLVHTVKILKEIIT